ncbi:HNH endonuclease, partial [Clavibacter michiganensis subsp. insidiosus]
MTPRSRRLFVVAAVLLSACGVVGGWYGTGLGFT